MLILCAGCSVAPAWTELFDGKSLQGWVATEFGGEGEVSVNDGRMVLGQGWSLTGVTWKGEELPAHGYEVQVRGRKLKGHDFFAAITFPVGEGFCSLVLGGWGGDVVGISSIDGMDADSNATRQLIEFKKDQAYDIKIQVTKAAISASIDGKEILAHPVPDYEFTVRGEMTPCEPFGIASYETESAFTQIRWRPLPKHRP